MLHQILVSLRLLQRELQESQDERDWWHLAIPWDCYSSWQYQLVEYGIRTQEQVPEILRNLDHRHCDHHFGLLWNPILLRVANETRRDFHYCWQVPCWCDQKDRCGSRYSLASKVSIGSDALLLLWSTLPPSKQRHLTNWLHRCWWRW